MPAATTAQKINFLFSAESGYGWSETYYWLGTALVALNAAVNNLLFARAAILSTDAQIDYVRLASPYSRSPILLDAQASGSIVGTGGSTSGPDFVSLVMRLQGNAGGIGRLFLRGVPEDQYTGDQLTFAPFYGAALTDFLQELTQTGNWGVQTSTVQAPRIRYNATALTPLSPRGYSFLLQASPSWTVGQFIRMHQAVNVGYNGLKQAVSISGAGPYTINVGGAAPNAADSGANNPYITVINYTYPIITGATFERISRRSPGRFFGQRRGRRSTTLPLRR
jgi:hypothetical protein